MPRSGPQHEHPPAELVGTKDEPPPPPLRRQLVAEVFGAFFLTFAAAGTAIGAERWPTEVDSVAKAAGPGLVVMALIYAVGDVSGAHFNPAVTLAFAVRGVFAWVKVIPYWCAQLLGAVLAAWSLQWLLDESARDGLSHGRMTDARIFVGELLLTLLLVTVILNAAHQHRLIGTDAALAVGATIGVAGFIGGAAVGASMNPARSLGPAFVVGELGQQWMYVAGPVAGALAAAALSFVFHPHRDRASEKRAAEGVAR